MNSSVVELHENYLKSDSHTNTVSGVGNRLVYSINIDEVRQTNIWRDEEFLLEGESQKY